MKRAVLAAAVVLSQASSVVARADEVARGVEIAVTGGGAENALLEATIQELLERVDLRFVHAPAAAYVPLLSRVVVDLSDPSIAKISVVDARDGTPILVRDLVRDPSPSVAREEIAHTIQSAVEAERLKRAPVNVPVPVPENAPAPAPTPSPAESASPRPADPSLLALDVATFVAAGPIAKSSGVAPRVGGGLGLALASTPLRPSLTLLASYAPPFETATDVIRARSSFVSLRATPAIEILHTPSVTLDWGVGGGFDVLTVTPVSDVLPSSRLKSSSSDIDVLLTSSLTLRAGIVPSVFFFASAGVEIDAFTRPYVVQRGSENEDLFVPWSVRPMLALGFSFTAAGRR